MKIKELPLLERPIEKFMSFGADKLSDAELLAIIIKTGTKDKTAVELIQELMNKNDYDNRGLSFLNEMSLDEIQMINGFGKTKALQLKVIFEIARRISKPASMNKLKITAPADVAKLLMEDLRYLNQEHLLTILLDYQNQVINIVTNTIGGLNLNIIEPREIFKEPIKKSASKLILVHNHPTGNPYPSDSDVKLTKRVCECGKIFGIELIDHVIIGNGVYSSLKELKKF